MVYLRSTLKKTHWLGHWTSRSQGGKKKRFGHISIDTSVPFFFTFPERPQTRPASDVPRRMSRSSKWFRPTGIDRPRSKFTHRGWRRGHVLALVESLAKLAISSSLLIFLPTLSLLPVLLFPVTSEISSRSEITEQCLKVCCIFRSDAVLSRPLKPASTCSLMSLRLTSCGRQQTACNGGGWEKEAKRRAKMMPEKIELQNLKNLKARANQKRAVAYVGPLVVGMKVDVVNDQSFSSYLFSVLLCASSIWKKKRWFTVKEAFLLQTTWLVCKRDAAHRSSCQCRHWFNWLDDDAVCPPKTRAVQRKKDRTSSSLLH